MCWRQACAHVDHVDVLAQLAPVDREAACLLMHILLANAPDAGTLAWHLRGCCEQPPVRSGQHALGRAGELHSHRELSQGAPQRWRQQAGAHSPGVQGHAGDGAFI